MDSSHNARPFSVLLVGFQDQDNLGLRYLMSSVKQHGFQVKIVTYQKDPEPLVAEIQKENPDVVGFSLIFQYMAPDFARIISRLRDVGTQSHITMGGHYPSFDYGEVLKQTDGLDSIVRFEGEETLIELLQRLRDGVDWHDVHGLAYLQNEEVIATPLRPSIADLDSLPLPYREDIDYESNALPTASILGSRGCPWDCSFCSIRPFYEAQEGKLRRLRKPEAIVDEMAMLHHERNVSVFLFQDDDFLAGGKAARQWAKQIAANIIDKGLPGRIAIKISCRSDEIHEETLRYLMDAGLTHVYMGVESGDEQGLINMSKRLKPATHLTAGNILKSLGLTFDFGFMLLDPYSTFESVRNNIKFLEQFVGDGWSVASFCRMLPYSGTPIAAKLQAENRLKGTPFEPDYRFLDPKLDIFYSWMLQTFHERNFTNKGLCHILRSLLFEAHLPIQVQGQKNTSRFDTLHLHHFTRVCNRIALYTLTAAIEYIEATALEDLNRDQSYLATLTRHEKSEEDHLLHEIADYYWTVKHTGNFESKLAQYELLGGFENSWTLEATT